MKFKIYKKIDLYVFITTLMSSFFALLLLTIIESFFTFLTELQALGNSDYSISKMLLYLLYDSPNRIHRIIPMGLLLGVLIGLGQLSAANEISVMRAAGLSKLRITFGAIMATILVSIVALNLGEFVVPPTKKIAETIQSNAKEIRQGKGFWAISNKQIIHVSATQGVNLSGISFYNVQDNKIKSILNAPAAYLNHKDWLIKSSTLKTITPEAIILTQQEEQSLPTVIDQRALSALSSDPENMAMKELWRFIKYLENNGLDASQYRLAFWVKTFAPFTNLSMLVIALPFVFGNSRQKGLGTKLLLGILIGLGIYLGSQMLAHFILLYNYLPIFGAIIPIIISLGLGLLFFKLAS